MSENRWLRLERLIGVPYSQSEAELDESDPWRYTNLLINSHNDHWNEVLEPSWLLAPDESMAPWTANEGTKPTDIPFLSNVPRKPKPLGGELKATCDGESGAVIRLEWALCNKRRRSDPQVEGQFEDEWGAGPAQLLRLVEPWHGTNRCVGGDAHFISVKSLEAGRAHVSYHTCT